MSEESKAPTTSGFQATCAVCLVLPVGNLLLRLRNSSAQNTTGESGQEGSARSQFEDDQEPSDGETEDSGFDESVGGLKDRKHGRSLKNEKYDMALEVSASGSLDAEALDEARATCASVTDDHDRKDEKLEVSRPGPGPGTSAARGSSVTATAITASSSSRNGGGGKTKENMKNDQFDAAYELSSGDDSSVETEAEDIATKKKRTIGQPPSPGDLRIPDTAKRDGSGAASDVSDASESGSESSSNDGRRSHLKVEGAYNPVDYDHLNVSPEIKDLFQYIGRYKPQEVELETTLRCFVPDFIPAVGEMDAFVKVPPPDSEPDDLGLKVLDEPAADQSDASVLELHLRAISKKHHGDVAVRSIENAHKNSAEIDKWILSINDLHRTQPLPQVHYRKSMPDVELLMEVWPPEFEAILEHMNGLTPELDMSLESYARMICAVMDIPVHDNLIESLHLLFTTYMEFKSNAHFMQLGDAGAKAEGPSELI